MSPIKVMLVDDHEVVRMGLRAILEAESDLEVVGDAGSAAVALDVAALTNPDVVLMDVSMPDVDGIEGCRLLRERCPDAKVVMLTSFGHEDAVMSAIMAGASGFLLKNTGRAGLLKAIRTVAHGESLLDPSVTAGVLERLKVLSQREDPEVASLSEREREVLSLVARGHTNKEIAQRLIITENTARNHVSRILDKLGLGRRSEAATFAAQHNLIEEDDEEKDA